MSQASTVVVVMAAAHWPAVRDIYAEGIETGHATFEAQPPTWEAFDRAKLTHQRFVAVDPHDQQVLGWVAATGVSDRCAYAGVVEHSVFVAARARGRGVGRLLLEGLIASTESAGVWTIQSGVFPENQASLALHLAAGFRVVGIRERVALMSYGPLAGVWRDVVMVERRSARVGLDTPS